MAILSNSIGSSDDRAYAGALAVERTFGLPVIRHKNKKPQCLEEVCISSQFNCTLYRSIYYQVMQFLDSRCPGITPTEVCIIGLISFFFTFTFLILKYFELFLGDRVLTDVVFANQNKMLSVLVSPLSIVRDHPIATILR